MLKKHLEKIREIKKFRESRVESYLCLRYLIQLLNIKKYFELYFQLRVWT